MTWTEALQTSNNWHDPVGTWVQQSEMAKRFYAKYPCTSRGTMVGVNAIFGFVKPFMLPLTAAIGFIVQPIIAAVKGYQGDTQAAKTWLKAWTFNLLALGGMFAFLYLSAYHMTLIQGTACIVTGISISIVIHVYRVSDTTLPKELRQG